MANSRDKYYTEMNKNINDYNDHNNETLSNDNIQEEINKSMKEESISDANNVTVVNFNHMSNTQRENANAIFTSEKLDKLDKLEEKLKDLIINNDKYYASKYATASDLQDNLTHDSKTVTINSNGNDTVTHTRIGNFEQKL